VCAHLGDSDRAAELYELLLPFERRNVVTAQSLFDGPVTRYLGVMAATCGEWETAARHFESARAAAARQNARAFVALVAIDEARMLVARNGSEDRPRALQLLNEARAVADELGMDRIVAQADELRRSLGDVEVHAALAAPAKGPDEPARVVAHLRREGDVWAFRFDGQDVHIRDSKGVRCLAVLLAHPGVEIAALELAGPAPNPDARAQADSGDSLSVSHRDDAGPALDSEAKTAYRRRLNELGEELEEAEAFRDPERAAKAREEMDFLARELAAAVGLGRRDRKTASNAERARVAVTKAVRATLRRIGEMHEPLGAELAATIRTGTFCSYEPDRRRPVSWTIEPG